jgi:dGTPase
MAVRVRAAAIVRELFSRFFERPDLLPSYWRAGFDEADAGARARRVSDYIAGMTDTFALDEHRRLFGSSPGLN